MRVGAGDPRLDDFHRGIYWDEFAEQHEPLATWHAALRGEKPYELTIELEMQGERIVGGICIERYPRSGCGLLTYIVVAPELRGQGLGKRLQTAAIDGLYARGAPVVFGELDDPRRSGDAIAWERVHRNQRWGARVVETRYVQPALGDGLERDRQLLLIAFRASTSIDGALLRTFLDEFYAATEGGPPDPEIAIPDVVPLITL